MSWLMSKCIHICTRFIPNHSSDLSRSQSREQLYYSTLSSNTEYMLNGKRDKLQNNYSHTESVIYR